MSANCESSPPSIPPVLQETVERKVNVAYGSAAKKTSKTFNFDRVFGMYSTQEEVFQQMVRHARLCVRLFCPSIVL